jgi:hypothetical protein
LALTDLLSNLLKKKSLVSVVGILLTVLAFYAPVLLGNQVFTWDTLDYSFPLAIYLRDAFEIGTWPFWNPFILSGESMFAQPAASVYHPFHLIIAIAPSFIDSFALLQFLLVCTPVIGAFGFRAFLKDSEFSEIAQFFGAVVFGITSFGPLLGQMPIALGIAMFPWVLLSAKRVFSLGHFSFAQASGLALLSAFTFYGSYFGVTLYLGIFTALYLLVTSVWKKPPSLKAGVLNIGLAAVLTLGLVAPHILPTLENRNAFYSDISSQFVSPDPRVRGVNLPEQHIVEIIPNERTLLGILVNSKDLARDGAFWVMGPGFSILFLSLLTFWPRVRRKRWYLYFGGFVIGTSYVLGPKSAVFDFVYAYVPVLNNIRYPVFSFPFVITALVLLALRNLDALVGNSVGTGGVAVEGAGVWTKRNRLLLLAAITAEVFVFGFATGIWNNRIPAIVTKVTNQEREAMSLSDRKVAPVIDQNLRKILDGRELKFSDRSWIRDKRPMTHGYSTSDSPLYWYLKDAQVLSKIAYCPTKNVLQAVNGKLSNQKMEAAGAQLSGLLKDEVIVGEARSTGNTFQPCKVTSVVGKPNSWVIDVESGAPSLLVLMDKNYPGWSATVDGSPVKIETVNYLFKAVSLTDEGSHRIEFNFNPESIFLGIRVAFFTLILLCLGLILQRWQRSRYLKNSSAKL